MTCRLTILLVFIFALGACGADNGGQAAEPEITSDDTLQESAGSEETPAESALRDPEKMRQAMRDPAQREALLEAMREQRARRGETDDDRTTVDREAMRERMHERREELVGSQDPDAIRERMRERRMGRSNWWENESIVESVGLAPEQAQSLSVAHQALEQTRTASRQRLAQSQRELAAALHEVDREQISELLEERAAASAAIARAEADWLQSVLGQLTDDQLQAMARNHPELLSPRAR